MRCGRGVDRGRGRRRAGGTDRGLASQARGRSIPGEAECPRARLGSRAPSAFTAGYGRCALQRPGKHLHHAGDQGLQLGQSIPNAKHDDDREREVTHVLLMLDAAVDREEGRRNPPRRPATTGGRFRCLPNPCSAPCARERCRKGRSEASRHRFVKQQLHRRPIPASVVARSRTATAWRRRHGRVVHEKIVEPVARLEVLHQDPHRNPGACKHGRSSKDLRIAVDQRVGHRASPIAEALLASASHTSGLSRNRRGRYVPGSSRPLNRRGFVTGEGAGRRSRRIGGPERGRGHCCPLPASRHRRAGLDWPSSPRADAGGGRRAAR